ncbi:hypothetical protein [Jiangella alba]|uniref:Uncharacterized protein n=1 Tax=Jiangella alba TaxID=561176 RepID=A0A1H5ITJ1_9ACTN|nr:hypothetical protein [Jiangella alba]SEE42778.1 hypothetical protein SAMN04488561_1289 [Jiangella alba]
MSVRDAIRQRTMSGLAAAALATAALAAAPAATATAAPAADAGIAQTAETKAGCYSRQNYTGGRWLKVRFCAGVVHGSSGFVEREIWLDRASSSRPSTWTPRLGLRRSSYYTSDVRLSGGPYWRTCIKDNQNRIYCTAWHR